MVDLKLTSSTTSPVLFACDGCQVLVLPMMTDKSKEAQKAQQPQEQAPAEAVVKAKPKRSRKREPVAVA
jgi:hypothetical protein